MKTFTATKSRVITAADRLRVKRSTAAANPATQSSVTTSRMNAVAAPNGQL